MGKSLLPERRIHRYRTYPAPKALRPFVRRFLLAEAPLGAGLALRPYPTGCCYLGHVFRGPGTGETLGMQPPRSGLHLTGQVERPGAPIRRQGPFGHLMAELAPSALYRLFHIEAAPIAGRSVDCAALLPPMRMAALTVNIVHGEAPAETRIAAMGAALAELIRAARPPVGHVEAALARIEAEGGRIDADDLAEALGISAPALTEDFRRVVGLAPQAYASAVRFGRAAARAERLAARRAAEAAQRPALRKGHAAHAPLLVGLRRAGDAPPRPALAPLTSLPGAPPGAMPPGAVPPNAAETGAGATLHEPDL